MSKKDEALKMALEALEQHGCPWIRHEKPYNEAITAIRVALASKSEALMSGTDGAHAPTEREQPAYRAVKTFHEGKPVYVAEQPAQHRVEKLLEIFKDVDQCGPLLGMKQPAPMAEPHEQQSAERGEPVGMWMGDCIEWTENPYKFRKGQPLYTSPPIESTPLASQRSVKPWRGLTDKDLAGCDDEEFKQARYWEQVLREKNT